MKSCILYAKVEPKFYQIHSECVLYSYMHRCSHDSIQMFICILKTGLPASPYITSTTISSKESNAVVVSLRAEITGIVSNNVTLTFEITATSNTLPTIRNFTVIDYVSPNDASLIFNGLREGVNYTFRSRVFNIYGASEYSASTARILIDGE